MSHFASRSSSGVVILYLYPAYLFFFVVAMTVACFYYCKFRCENENYPIFYAILQVFRRLAMSVKVISWSLFFRMWLSRIWSHYCVTHFISTFRFLTLILALSVDIMCFSVGIDNFSFPLKYRQIYFSGTFFLSITQVIRWFLMVSL